MEQGRKGCSKKGFKSKEEYSIYKGKPNCQPSRNKDIKCFKFLGASHIASQCPNKKVMIMCDNEVMIEGENDGESMLSLKDATDNEIKYVVEGEALVSRHVLNSQVKEDNVEKQRENIFHTRCLINNKVCSMIDGGSFANVASTTLVEKLNLSTIKHPRPYKLQWLNDCGEVKVKHQVLVSISIGRYNDEVLYDVVPMQVRQMLLGRPWEFDRRENKDGHTNIYSFVMNNRFITLASLSPKQVYGDQIKMNKDREKKEIALKNKDHKKKSEIGE